jgi:hypothetical protein
MGQEELGTAGTRKKGETEMRGQRSEVRSQRADLRFKIVDFRLETGKAGETDIGQREEARGQRYITRRAGRARLARRERDNGFLPRHLVSPDLPSRNT